MSRAAAIEAGRRARAIAIASSFAISILSAPRVDAGGAARSQPLPPALASQVRVALAPWVALLRRCGAARFGADSLRWGGPDTLTTWYRRPLRRSGWYDPSRAYVYVAWAPDRRHGIDPDIYQWWSTKDGELAYDANEATALIDVRDSTWDCIFQGGFFSEVRWLDNRHVLLVGEDSNAAPGRETWRPIVYLLDVSKR